MVSPAAEAKSITIQKQTETSNGLIVGDPDRLLQSSGIFCLTPSNSLPKATTSNYV
jgi:hypothetical protein